MHVVGIQHRLLGHLDQPFAAEHDDVGVGLGHDAEVAEEVGRAADGSRVGGFQQQRAAVILDDARLRQKRDQRLLDADRAAPGTAAAVGGAEGLVQVDMDHVEADVPRA